VEIDFEMYAELDTERLDPPVTWFRTLKDTPTIQEELVVKVP
jgi:hypothetical protein